MKGKYGTLACLVEHLGAEHLLNLDAGLPSRLLGLMGDQTLSPYASDLLEKLFVSHKAQLCARCKDGSEWIDGWHEVWVMPLLQLLCTARLDQTTYILDYFLPKLLRCNPSSLSHMVQALREMPSYTDGIFFTFDLVWNCVELELILTLEFVFQELLVAEVRLEL